MSDDNGAGTYPHADGYNAGLAEELYERSLRERGIVPPSLADWVERADSASAAPPAATAPTPAVAPATAAPEQLRIAAAAGSLVEDLRTLGHLNVQIDPLGTPRTGHPSIEPDFHGITWEDLETIPSSAIGLERLGGTARDAVERLREIYAGRIGYELDHMEDPKKWNWLVDYIESGRHLNPVDDHGKVHLLRILTEVEGFESFLQRSYLGQKRFSIEGLDMMVPMIRRIIRRTALGGTQKYFIGMAHRGRLNVLTHIIGFSYEAILAEFEGEASKGMQDRAAEAGSGDVKYHVGARELVRSQMGELEISLAPNPSHLEHVNPVVQGMARAERERMARESGLKISEEDESGLGAFGTSVLPILVHGDAAFMGQGIVPETLNLSRLPGYENGGTIHIVANNQLGFTTDPRDSRSSRYASDIALAFRMPIVHVNADDPEACLSAVQLAIDFHLEFSEDVVVDLVGYRRYGHNEGDEPAYTQPVMYQKIREHPTVRSLWVDRLVDEGVIERSAADQMASAINDRLTEARKAVSEDDLADDAEDEDPDISAPTAGSTLGIGMEVERERPRGYDTLTEEDDWRDVATGIDAARAADLNSAVHAWPEDFTPNAKLARQLVRRRDSLENEIDWAHAEALAFAGLLTEGIPVRLSGEDSERGTFSQRHLVMHDAETGGQWTPLKHLGDGQGQFQVWNSSLSEAAVLGFEYGYASVATDSLVLWEAQFGDFANVAQAIIDQFIVAGRSKWGQESRLVLLLPHGYEGQGPEHSSARLERFLELAAEDNIRVANCTTPSQYFHLLRLQALRPARRPLVVMTPKSLLRHPRARSGARDLAGGFEPILPAAGAGRDPAGVRRLLLCSGKIYYDLTASEAWEPATSIDLARVELLYPFPRAELEGLIGRYPSLEEIVWVQEEPENMGGWRSVEPELRALTPEAVVMRYVGRPASASPAEGYAAAHAAAQARIVEEALAGGQS
ncbi:MAG: 2-oxoglutarate dehydrogenase E1 component [marine benthic group bacterium]|nr:2-oxoglutarate dehydrogenase E1 component [Candidatus Benthicola marisminoris]